MQSLVSTFGFGVALITTIKLAYNVLRFIDLHFFVPSSPLKSYKLATPITTSDQQPASDPTETEDHQNSLEAWALITGSSAGIGYSFAHTLLSYGFDVILLANTGLEDAHSRLSSAFPARSIKSVPFDCATATPAQIADLAASFSSLPITILINNVGGWQVGAQPKYSLFKDYSHEDVESQYRLNGTFATHLTLALFPSLQQAARKTRSGRALVLTVSSISHVGTPYVSVYCACKSYLLSLSAALTRECRAFNTPIDCLAILPGDTLSASNSAAMAAGALTSEEFAACALERVDKAVSRGMRSLVPYWRSALEYEMTRWIPENTLRGALVTAMEGKRDWVLGVGEEAKKIA